MLDLFICLDPMSGAGSLVGKTLMTAVSGPFVMGQANNALVSLDVFSLQARCRLLLAPHTILCSLNVLACSERGSPYFALSHGRSLVTAPALTYNA